MLAERDDLVEQAINVVRETQRASASLLQRRLRIGYPRAARLIDELEELGVVGRRREAAGIGMCSSLLKRRARIKIRFDLSPWLDSPVCC